MAKYRSYIFTYNNYPDELNTDDPLDTWLHGLGGLYAVAGREISPTTQTPHLQGYVRWKNPRSITTVRALLTGCHVEPAKGTPVQCRTYCIKDQKYRECGTPPVDPGDAEKLRWSDALSAAKAGRFDEIPADIYIRYVGNLHRIRRDTLPPLEPLPNTCGFWVYGPTGSGKSRGVRGLYPELYPKPMNKWWDSYTDQPNVLIDDVDYNHSSWIGYFLKIWADHYPFIAEVKGGSRLIRPDKIIVTSQYTIETLFQDAELRSALLRRFTVITKIEGEAILGF
nr:replication protein A [Mute swan feces associated circular virus 5]